MKNLKSLIYKLVCKYTNYDEKYRFNYMMLSRLQSDCKYFLGHGNRNVKVLYYDSIEDHIAEMKRLWKSFPFYAKPEWLSYRQILVYEAEMKKDITE